MIPGQSYPYISSREIKKQNSRVGSHIRAVKVFADTIRVVVHPSTHSIVRVPGISLLETNSRGHKVTPALTHTTRLGTAQTSTVGATTRQTSRHTVGVLMDNHTRLERSITDGVRLGPEVHAHTTGLSIGRSGEIGIVGTGTILCVEDDVVVTRAAVALVVDLEVVRRLGEAELVQEIVVGVGSVEELGDRGIVVVLGVLDCGVVIVLKVIGGRLRAVVVDVAGVRVATGLSLRVDLCDSVVTPGGVVALVAVVVPSQGRVVEVPGVGEGDTVTLIGVVDTPLAV